MNKELSINRRKIDQPFLIHIPSSFGMDNALMGLEEANVAAEQGKLYFMNALRRAKNMRKNRPQHMSMNELCVFDNCEKCNQARIFEHVLKQRKRC